MINWKSRVHNPDWVWLEADQVVQCATDPEDHNGQEFRWWDHPDYPKDDQGKPLYCDRNKRIYLDWKRDPIFRRTEATSVLTRRALGRLGCPEHLALGGDERDRVMSVLEGLAAKEPEVFNPTSLRLLQGLSPYPQLVPPPLPPEVMKEQDFIGALANLGEDDFHYVMSRRDDIRARFYTRQDFENTAKRRPYIEELAWRWGKRDQKQDRQLRRSIRATQRFWGQGDRRFFP